jgi:fluoride ion exporter CrcB/FEX
MMTENRWISFAFYTSLSVFAGLLATYLGYKITTS